MSKDENRNRAKTKDKHEIDIRENIFIGAWNVRTLHETGKLEQVSQEIDKYKLDIVGLSETRWNGSGSTRVGDQQLMIYSGNTDVNDKHEKGVAILLAQKGRKALVEWEPVSERIIWARLKARYYNIIVINVYAPTNKKRRK